MIEYEIPGMGNIKLNNLCLDYNGTIAYEGKLIEGVEEKVKLLKDKLNIYILTADTNNTVRKECEKLGVEIKVFDRPNASECKEEIVKGLSGDTISIGNGLNDIKMFDISKLSLIVVGKEGAYTKSIGHATIVVNDILDAFNIIIDKNKMKATLRN